MRIWNHEPTTFSFILRVSMHALSGSPLDAVSIYVVGEEMLAVKALMKH